MDMMTDSSFHWSKEKIYPSMETFFNALEASIQKATQSIDIETYIFEKEGEGQKILNALRVAAARGVQVRLLLDGVGCTAWSQDDARSYEQENFQIRFFHPLPWQRRSFRIWDFFQLKRIVMGLSLLNRRNHRKTYVFDGKIAFIGGMNIMKEPEWRDMSVEIEGEKISLITRSFEENWKYAKYFGYYWGLNSRSGYDPHVRLNTSRVVRRKHYHELLSRIRNAKKRVWLGNSYFIPPLALVRAMRIACKNKVDVKLILPKKYDIWAIQWAPQAFYEAMVADGVEVYEYQPTMLHEKVMLIDDWVVVGSSNLNHRSLFHDLEIDVLLTHTESIQYLEQQFSKDLLKSEKVSGKVWRKRGFYQRVLEWLSLPFRRWI